MVKFVESFQAIFATSGETFLGLVVGIVPMVLVLLTVFNAITAMIGGERLDRFAKFLAKHRILAYTVLPFVSWFLLCNPMVFTTAKFLPQRMRAGYIDAVGTANGPMMSLFPHTNPAELFVWLGIANGVQALGLPTSGLAIRFFIAGWLLALVRAHITEFIWVFLAKREGIATDR